MSNRLINTTFTGKDISAGTTIVYTYTATKAATVRFRIGLGAVAGGGDYIFWLTLQRGGAGAVFTVLPKTTGTAAAAETALGVVTIPIDVVASDVINVYVDGLAGDTNESGTVEVFEDDYLRPVTAAQYAVDVTAGGAVGVDWANVEAPTTTVGLSGTTVKAVTDGMGLADDAITAAKYDESTAFPLKSADTGATQVARVGADADTLETLSDQADLQGTLVNQTTILNRIGAFTGAGINNILGALRALAAKAAGLTPTDISAGTTFDNTTDSGEAVRDRGDAAWMTAGGFAVPGDAMTLTAAYDAAKTAAQAGDSMALTAAAVDLILDDVVEGTYTLRQLMRLFAAMLLGKATGGATVTITFRDIGDSKNRIVLTVDANGNRSAVVLDAS